MTDPYQPVIDLTDYSFSEHGNAVNPAIELFDDSRLIQPNRSPRRARALNRHMRTIYPHRHIVNEVPIEVPDSPQLNIDASVRRIDASVRRKVTRTTNRTNQENERNVDCVDPVRERSPLGGGFGVCPICLETLGSQPLVSTKCGHVYCQKCLTLALRSEKKCPTCRKPLKGNTAYHPLFLNRG